MNARIKAAAFALTCSLATADVLDVDASAGPYFEISSAVAAASDGDLIRVRAGTYGFFGIFGKELSVVGTEPGVIVAGGIRVQNSAPGTLVHLAGLDVRPTRSESLIIAQCAGSVRIDACALANATYVDPAATEAERYGATRVLGAADVELVECTGGGLSADGSRVALHGCTLTGNDGSFCTWENGFHAVFATDSDIVIQDSALVGGAAGFNDDHFCPGICGCGNAGAGLAVGFSHVVVNASTLRHGSEGPGFLGSCALNGCGWGGNDIYNTHSTIVDGVTIAPTLTPSHSTVVEGDAVAFILTGAPGSSVALIGSFEGQSLSLPGASGHLLIRAPSGGRRVQLGLIPSSGSLNWTYTAPQLGPGTHLPLHVQSGEIDTAGMLTLGPARVIHLLDSTW